MKTICIATIAIAVMATIVISFASLSARAAPLPTPTAGYHGFIPFVARYLTPTPTPTPSPTPMPDFTITGDWRLGNSIIVFGEITNNGSAARHDIIVRAKYYDADGQYLGSAARSTGVEVLNAGETTCFMVYKLGNYPGTASYVLDVSRWEEATARPLLTGHDISASVGSDGYLHVQGTARNDSQEPVLYPEVTGTLYDENHRVVGCKFRPTYDSLLGPGDESGFHITYYQDIALTAKSLRLQYGSGADR